MVVSRGKAALLAVAIAIVPALLFRSARGSDHADTPFIANNPGVDISDVYVFPSPANANNVVLVMNVHPLIGPTMVNSTFFDPNVLYQFKIDNTGDAVEDLVVQAKFGTQGPNQSVSIAMGKPAQVGIVSSALPAFSTVGTFNKTFSPTSGVQVFAGPREDSFFFDLDQFFTILPDRATPVNGIPVANPNVPQAASFRPAGEAVDFLSANKLNVLSIVIELPKTMVKGSGSGKIGVWCTTSLLGTSRQAR